MSVALILGLGLGSTAALYAEDEGLSNESMYVLQRSQFKPRPIEFSVVYDIDTSSSYYTAHGVGGSLDWRISQNWLVGARYTKYFEKSTTVLRELEDALDRDLSSVHVYRPKDVTEIHVGILPLSGLLNLFSMKVFNFDILATFGVASMSFEPRERSLALSLGLKSRLYFTDRIGIFFGPTFWTANFDDKTRRSRVLLEMGAVGRF